MANPSSSTERDEKKDLKPRLSGEVAFGGLQEIGKTSEGREIAQHVGPEVLPVGAGEAQFKATPLQLQIQIADDQVVETQNSSKILPVSEKARVYLALLSSKQPTLIQATKAQWVIQALTADHIQFGPDNQPLSPMNTAPGAKQRVDLTQALNETPNKDS